MRHQETLYELRKEAGFKTATETAKYLGVSYRTYLSWENKARKTPKIVTNFLKLYISQSNMKSNIKKYVEGL